MNLLCLDYGTSRIGVAISTSLLAEPLVTLNTSDAFAKITRLIKEHRIEKIIIGSGDERTKPKIIQFINLFQIPNLQFEIVDETLSSYDARTSLLHTTQTKRRQKEHAVAATLILQSYLDSQVDR